MNRRTRLTPFVMGLVVFLVGVFLQAQQAPPEMVLYNGKIVTVDDYGFTSRLGTIAQAMHVKDGKVVHLGTNAQIRAMAGTSTKMIDLKGRTVVPGLLLTHEHPFDWNNVEPYVVKKILTDDSVVTRFMEGSPEENMQAFPGVLAEALQKAKPGQWIYIVITFGKNYEYSMRGNAGAYARGALDKSLFNILDGNHITKEQVDAVAPNNPVVLRDVFVDVLVNQKALEESRKVFPDQDVNNVDVKTGKGNADTMRWFFSDVVMKDYYPQMLEISRLGLEWWAGYGLTTFSSNIYNPKAMKIYGELDRKGQMAVRTMWTWNWRAPKFFDDGYFVNDLVNRIGTGTDHMWFGGAVMTPGGSCTSFTPIPGRSTPDIDAAIQRCRYGPGSTNAKLLYEYIKAGGRWVNDHITGDREVDNIFTIISQASKEAGFTDDEIRAKRHAFDHGVMWPRPDQVETMKKYAMIGSQDPFEIYDVSPGVFHIFGEKAVEMIVPKKSLVDGGIYNSMEIDRALGTTNFTIFSGISWLVNRKAWDGKVYAPIQKLDRGTALKSATIWGAYYCAAEKKIGSLEPGKWADFLVLDRDYMAIPEDDIGNIRVLMTVVGGKVIHLVPSLAREIGMQPAGSQVTMGPAAQW